MLLDRKAELVRIDRLHDDARAGHSAVLVIRGEPGIGKSALCDQAIRRAEGMLVLKARGFESESELPFAGLSDLFRPVIGRLASIPAPQGAALAGALALGPPVAGDRFTVCAATLSLLAAVAEEDGPVLAVVDEAQWLDRSSAEALLFAARRLDAEAVAMLIAARGDEVTPFDRARLPELQLGGLPADAAAALVDQNGASLAPEVRERLIRSTGGNPLALLELPPLLTEEQRRGTEPLGPVLPTTEALEHAFLHRVRALSETSRFALLVAAASASADSQLIYRALRQAAVPSAALDAAEEAGLISVEDELIEFRHPLLRAAVYRGAPAGARRGAHKALAEASLDDVEGRRAWHLAASTPEPDPDVAALLADTGLAARRRGGHAEAASAFERAARLSVDTEQRAQRLREAADDARLGGEPERALRLLDEALAATCDISLRARIQHLRAAVEMWQGTPMSAYRHLTDEAKRIERSEPAKAAWMLADAGWACFMAGEIATGRTVAERAAKIAADSGGGVGEIVATALHGIALLLTGQRKQAEPLLRRYEPLLDDLAFLERGYAVAWPGGQVLIWLEEYAKARDVLVRLIEAARAKSAPTYLPYTLTGLAELEFRNGAWPTAQANVSEAVRLAEETAQPAALGFALATLARIEAAQGREDDCRGHVRRASELAAIGVRAIQTFADSACGLLELGLGRCEEAVARLEPIAQATLESGLAEPAVIQWAPDLIEAYVRCGRTGEARAAVTRFEQEARASGGHWALAAAARCKGLLADADVFERDFAEALSLHGQTPMPFERARTQLCFGERLRRSRRRTEGRVQLRASLEGFERLGAASWIERARSELRASGESLRRRSSTGREELTPQELQVAQFVARGDTNREVGAALFLSPKTVESHLSHIYRKLGVRSRTELAALLAGEAAGVHAHV